MYIIESIFNVVCKNGAKEEKEIIETETLPC